MGFFNRSPEPFNPFPVLGREEKRGVLLLVQKRLVVRRNVRNDVHAALVLDLFHNLFFV